MGEGGAGEAGAKNKKGKERKEEEEEGRERLPSQDAIKLTCYSGDQSRHQTHVSVHVA